MNLFFNLEAIAGLLGRLEMQSLTYNSLPPKEIIGNEGQRIFVFHNQQFGFSNRFPSSFSVLGMHFSTVEKYFAWQKARYFADFEIAQHVLLLNNPEQIHRIGLRIRGFRADEWKKVQDKVIIFSFLFS